MPISLGKDKAVYKRITCEKCSTINQYLPEEVKVLWSDFEYGNGYSGARGFECFGCRFNVIVERY